MRFEDAVIHKLCLFMPGAPSDGCCGKARAPGSPNYCAAHERRCYAGKRVRDHVATGQPFSLEPMNGRGLEAINRKRRAA
jgi:hypothetical protein